MRWAVLLMALLTSGCALFAGPVVPPPPINGEPTGADTGSVR